MEPDFILLIKMRQRNDAAWDLFVRKYYADILKYCHFHCQDRESAEDLTQEVFLKFFAALAGYEHRGKAKNYLYTIAANLCKNSAAIPQALSLEMVSELGSDPSDQLDDRLALETAIRHLPEGFRETVLLHYYQGLKLSVTAAVLQIGLPLVKYRLKRAKELLRKELDEP